MGHSENSGYLTLGVLIIRILLFRVLYEGPLVSGYPPCRVVAAIIEEERFGLRIYRALGLRAHRLWGFSGLGFRALGLRAHRVQGFRGLGIIGFRV